MALGATADLAKKIGCFARLADHGVGQRQVPAGLRLRRVAPLLEDPVKAVRTATARALLDLLAGGYRLPAAETAFREYSEALAARADFPETQLVMAGTALTFRQFAQAESAFAEAVRLDPQLIDGWIMIARLRAAQNNEEGALETLRQGLKSNPENTSSSRSRHSCAEAGASAQAR